MRLTPQISYPLSSASPSSDIDYNIDMRVCKVTSGYSLPTGCRALIQEAAASNLVNRFERLCSSQNAVMKLLCQLARRSHTVDRRLDVITTDEDTVQSEWEPSEKDATIVSQLYLISITLRHSPLEHIEGIAKGFCRLSIW